MLVWFLCALLLFPGNKCVSDAQIKEYNSINVAASIVEHRPLANLPYVILNFLELLPSVVSIYFFCSKESAILVQSTLQSKLGKQELERVLYIEGYFGGLAEIQRMTKLTYNRLLLDNTFWSVFERDAKESVLIFEHDSFLCSNPSKKFEEYLKYGYIGAPWVHRKCKTCKITRIRHAQNKHALPTPVGNSGLSIMNTKIMLNMTSFEIKKRTERLMASTVLRGGCDVYISTVLQDKLFSQHFSVGLAPVHVAKLFSVESLYDGYYVPFGGHSPCNFAKKLKWRCPQALDACLLLKRNIK